MMRLFEKMFRQAEGTFLGGPSKTKAKFGRRGKEHTRAKSLRMEALEDRQMLSVVPNEMGPLTLDAWNGAMAAGLPSTSILPGGLSAPSNKVITASSSVTTPNAYYNPSAPTNPLNGPANALNASQGRYAPFLNEVTNTSTDFDRDPSIRTPGQTATEQYGNWNYNWIKVSGVTVQRFHWMQTAAEMLWSAGWAQNAGFKSIDAIQTHIWENFTPSQEGAVCDIIEWFITGDYNNVNDGYYAGHRPIKTNANGGGFFSQISYDAISSYVNNPGIGGIPDYSAQYATGTSGVDLLNQVYLALDSNTAVGLQMAWYIADAGRNYNGYIRTSGSTTSGGTQATNSMVVSGLYFNSTSYGHEVNGPDHVIGVSFASSDEAIGIEAGVVYLVEWDASINGYRFAIEPVWTKEVFDMTPKDQPDIDAMLSGDPRFSAWWYANSVNSDVNTLANSTGPIRYLTGYRVDDMADNYHVAYYNDSPHEVEYNDAFEITADNRGFQCLALVGANFLLNYYEKLPVVPLNESMTLQSLPGAPNVIIIDGSRFGVDFNTANLTFQEKVWLQEIWQRVAEDFAPFNVNVTTDPTVVGSRYTASLDFWTPMDGSWRTSHYNGTYGYYSPAGMIAGLNGQAVGPSATTIAGTTMATLAKTIAEGISYAIGSGAGLQQATYLHGQGGSDPYAGHNDWGPIMGYSASVAKRYTQWSQGEYYGAGNTQDQIQYLTLLFGGLRPDTRNNHTINNATVMQTIGYQYAYSSLQTTIQYEGVIASRAQYDYYVLEDVAGSYTIDVFGIGADFRWLNSNSTISDKTQDNYAFDWWMTNLNLKLDIWEIVNGQPVLVQSVSSIGTSFAHFTIVPPDDKTHTYYFSVTGIGSGNAIFDGFSDYGSLGQYTIRVTELYDDLVKYEEETGQNYIVVNSLDDGDFKVDNKVTLREALYMIGRRLEYRDLYGLYQYIAPEIRFDYSLICSEELGRQYTLEELEAGAATITLNTNLGSILLNYQLKMATVTSLLAGTDLGDEVPVDPQTGGYSGSVPTIINANRFWDSVKGEFRFIDGSNITINASTGGTSSFRTIYVDNIEAEIYGVIITGGNAKANIDSNTSEAQQDNINQYGGGVFNNYGWLTIANTIIAGNSALKSGGGIYNRGGWGPMYWPQFTGSEFRFNDYFGQLLVYNSSIIGNITTYDYSVNTGSTGGGVYNDYVAQATFINCTIAGNVANWGGGGIDNNGYVSLLNSIVAKNYASRGTDIYTHAAGYYNRGGPGSARTFASYSIIGDANYSNDSDNGDPNRTLVPWDNGQKYGMAVVNTIGNTIGYSTTNIDGTRNNTGTIDPRFLVFSGRWVPWSGKYNANGYQLFQVVDASGAYKTGTWTIDLWQSWNLTITVASTQAINFGTSGTATDLYDAGLYEYYYNYYYSSVYDKIQREILQLPGALWDKPVPPGSTYLQDQVDFYTLIYANNYIYDSASSVTNMVSRRATRLTTAPVGSGINSWTATIFFSEFTDWMVSTKYTDQNIYDYAQRVLGLSNTDLDNFLLTVGTGYTLPALRTALRVTPTPAVRNTLETRLNTVYGATITGSIATYRTNRIDFQVSLGDTVLRNYWSNSYVYNSNSSVSNMAVRRNAHTGRPGYTPVNPLISTPGMSSWTSNLFISEFLDWMVSTDYSNQDIYDYAWLMLEISQATLDAMFAQIGTIDVGGLVTITINNLDDARLTLRRTDTVILIGGIGDLMRNGTYRSILGNLVDFEGMELMLNNQFGAQIDADIATYRANRINFQKTMDIKAYYNWKYGTEDPSGLIAGLADTEAQALANRRIADLKDLAGNIRIIGTKIDIGAYEYQAGKIDLAGFQPRIINTETVDYDWSYTIVAGSARGDRTGMGIKVDENTYDNLADPDYNFDANTITYGDAESALFLNFAFFNQGGATTAPITVNLNLSVAWDSENFKAGFPMSLSTDPWKYLSENYDPAQYSWNNGAGVWNTTLLSFTITPAYPSGAASRLSIAGNSAGWAGLHFVVGGITVPNLAFPSIDSTVAQLVDGSGELVGTTRLFSNGMVMVEDLFFESEAHSPYRGLYQFTMDLNPGKANKKAEVRWDNNVYSTIVQVIEMKTLVVDTTADVIDRYDGVTSIREAILYASSKKEYVKNLVDGNIVTIGNKNYSVIGSHLYTITTGDFLFTTNVTPLTNGIALTNGAKVTLTANIPVLYQVHNTQTGQWDSVEVILNNGTELTYNSAGYFTSGTSRYKLYDNTALTIVVNQNVQNVWYSSVNSVIATIASGTMIDFIYNPFNAKVNSGILQSVLNGYFAVPVDLAPTKSLKTGDVITLTTGVASVYRLRVNSLQYEMPSGMPLTLTFRDGLFYDATNNIYVLKPGQTFAYTIAPLVYYTIATSLSTDIVPAQRDRLVNKATGTVYTWHEAVGSAVAGWYDAQDRLYTPIAGVDYEYRQGEYETITNNVTVYYKEGSTIRTEQFYGETVYFDSDVFADSSAVITLDLELYGSLEIDRSITIDASVRYNKSTGELDPAVDSVIISTTSDFDDPLVNHDRVVVVYSDVNATFINLTITNGWADIGGGIYAEADSNLLLIDCNVDGNRADIAGGGIYALGKLELIGGSVSNNTVLAYVNWLDADESFYGGGIYYEVASPDDFLTLDGVMIEDNTIMVIVSDAVANVKVNAYGGGIYTNANLELTDSQILDNKIRFYKGITNAVGNLVGIVPLQPTDSVVPNSYGCGVYASGSVTIVGDLVQFIDNQLDGDDSKGGAIYAGGSVAITGNDLVVFAGSYAGSDGGAIYADSGDISITGDQIIFINNSSVGKGGAIYASGLVTITGGDVVFDSNSAGSDGGAIYADSGDISITGDQIIFINNSSVGKGGALYAIGSVTITGGDVVFDSNSAGSDGGAIYADSGDVTITGDVVSFVDNYAGGDGGAIYTLGSISIIGDIEFINNRADGDGGAIYVGEDIYLSLALFANNRALQSGGAVYATGNVTIYNNVFFVENESDRDGGAVYAGGNVHLVSALFTGNSTRFRGGAVYSNGTVTIDNQVEFVGNGSLGHGGALYSKGDIEIIGSSVSFIGNFALGNGGAIYAEADFMANRSFTLDGNTAEIHGGGIYGLGDIYIVDSSITANTAITGQGGAIYRIGSGSLIVINSAFVGNAATTGGGAIASWQGATQLSNVTIAGNLSANGGGLMASGNVYLFNTIIANNYQDNAVNKVDFYYVPGGGSTVSIYYSLVATGVVGVGGQVTPNVRVGAFLGTSASPIDPGFAIAPEFDTTTGQLKNLNDLITGGLVPKISSIAIDGGWNNYAVYPSGSPIVNDLLGKQRIYGPSVDMGAYELQQTALCDLDISKPLSVVPSVSNKLISLEITVENNALALASWKGILPYTIKAYMKNESGNWVQFESRNETWGDSFDPQFLAPGQSFTINYQWGVEAVGEYYFVVEVNPEISPGIRTFSETDYTNNIATTTVIKVAASSTIYVNTTEDYDPKFFGTDPSKMSLREALYWTTTPYYQDIGDITIKFDSNLGLTGDTTITIKHDFGSLMIERNVTIDASDVLDANDVVVGITLSGANASRILKVMDSYYDSSSTLVDLTATLKNLNFVGGNGYLDVLTNDPNDIVQSSGGAINNLARGGLSIYNCTFTGNVASHGGAIRNTGTGILTIYDSTFTSNSTRYEHRVNGILQYTYTGYNGGAISNGGVMVIDRSSFAGNEAGLYGGAIFQTGGMTIANSTIYGNKATHGGGILIQYTASASYLNQTIVNKMYNCTIAGNTGTVQGGGIWISSQVGTQPVRAQQKLQLVNSIVYGNSSPTGKDIYEQTAGVYENISSQVNVNPNFVSFNATNLATWSTWNLRLSATSTIVFTEAGNIGALPSQFSLFDLVGNARISNGVLSLGAYQYTSSAVPAALPSLAAVNQVSANSVYIRWNTTDSSTDFRVRYKEIDSNSWVYVNQVFGGTSGYVSGQFKADTTYIFQVQAIGDGVFTKDSAWSDAQQAGEALRAVVPGAVDLQGWSALQAVTFRFTGAQISSTMTSLASSQMLKLDVEATSLPSSGITGWVVSWGDNTETRLDANTTYLSLSHFYLCDGDYTITVCVLDGNASSNMVYTLGVFVRDTKEVEVAQLASVGQPSALPQSESQEPFASALPGSDFSFTQVVPMVTGEAETVVAPLSDSMITVDTVPSAYQRAEVEGKEAAQVPGANGYTAYGRYDQAFVDRWSRHLSRFSNRHLRSVQQNDLLFQEGDMFDTEFGFEGTSPQVNSSLFTEDILEEILS